MLLSLGTKGFRALQPNASSMFLHIFFWLVNFIFVVTNYMFQFSVAKLYLPKVNKSSGAVIDMWIKVKFQTSFLHESIEKRKYPIPACQEPKVKPTMSERFNYPFNFEHIGFIKFSTDPPKKFSSLYAVSSVFNKFCFCFSLFNVMPRVYLLPTRNLPSYLLLFLSLYNH